MDVSLADATVVFCYLGFEASGALKPKFERELQPGTKVIMESFPVPGWEPTRHSVVDMGCCGYTWFYLYTMPPQIAE